MVLPKRLLRLAIACLFAVMLAMTLACGGGDGPDEPLMCDGTIALYETCADSDECDSCLCFSFNMGDVLCTQACVNDNDCPAPSTGCNGMGVCKRPGG